MLAVGLTVALFVFWTLLGHALISLLRTDLGALRNALIAPTVGMVVNVVPVFLLSLIGLRVGSFAIVLAILLLLGAIASLAIVRPAFPWRLFLPFGIVLLFALLLVGSPMFSFGFDWVSFCNDDMANYAMGAHRFIDHGYFEFPDPNVLLQGRDYTEYLWFIYVPGMGRPGSELILAFVATVTRLLPAQVFMPVILAMHLSMISAAAGLVYQSEKHRPAALVTAALLTLSALASLGVLYQLIAQVAGVGLLCASGVLLMRSFDGLSLRDLLRHSALIGIVVAGLVIFYPEILPFLAVAYLIFVGVGVARRRISIKPLLRAAGIAAAASVIILNRYTLMALSYLLLQARSARTSENPQDTLFPYYLMPSGLANLWGFEPIAKIVPEPWQSLWILLAGILFIACGVLAVRMTWRGSPVAAYCVVMIAMALYLFSLRSGFGLFKLAMYAQPFLVGTLVIACLSRMRRPTFRSPSAIWQIGPLVLLAAGGLISQQSYVKSSRGVGRTLVEIPDASRTRIMHEMRTLVAKHPSDRYLLDSYNLVVAKFQGMSTRGREAVFPSNRFYRVGGYGKYLGPHRQEITQFTSEVIDKQTSEIIDAGFNLHDKGQSSTAGDTINHFSLNQLMSNVDYSSEAVLVGSTSRHVAFNRRNQATAADTNFFAANSRDVKNHLVFVASDMGAPYFSNGTKQSYSLFPLEHEPLFFKDHTMAGVGRHLLFRVINPTPKMRFMLELTESYRADKINALPPASVIGKDRSRLGFMGRGSARVVSEPIVPQMIEGQPYIALDMGEDGVRFAETRTWLMKLYGKDVATDRRRLVGFTRDMSLITEEQYAALSPPQQLSQFSSTTNDLLNPDLEYSGMYEDGWVGESSFYRLKPPAGPASVVVKGTVPRIKNPAYTTDVELLVDGKVVAQTTTGPGAFSLHADYVPANPSRVSSIGKISGNTLARLELRFSHTQSLPPDDNRPVGAQINCIGFESNAPAIAGSGGAGQ